MAMEQVLRMNGGVGETSYTRNSRLQEKVILKVKPIVEGSVKRILYCTKFERNVIKIVDLGCSSGSNTLLVIWHIIKTLVDNNKMSSNSHETFAAIQIYLNDLFGNDFKSIFESLPNFYQRVRETGDKYCGCFINATPGNFYGRLFPDNYIHLFHSSYSLHWLSQAPKELTKGGEPLNKGNIYITSTSPPGVYEAYFEQFKSDFKLFLKSRSDELIPGGSMVITFIGREKAPGKTSCPWVLLGKVLKDMALEGLVEEAKLDSFNLPLYGPTMDEVRQIIAEEGYFTLQTLKTFKIGWDADLGEDVDGSVVDTKIRGEYTAKILRSVFEPILSTEFGQHIMDELFSRLANKVSNLMELDTPEYINLVMHLTKET